METKGEEKLFDIGLEERDRLKEELGGGIPKRSIIVIEGKYGAGKSIFSQRFAYGLLEEEYNVTYLSTELDMNGFMNQMNSLGYNVERHILYQNLLFLRVYLQPKNSDDQNLLDRLIEAEKLWNSDLIIFDKFDAILRNDEKYDSLVRNDEERQRVLEIISFLRNIKADGKSVIMTFNPTNLTEDAMSPFRGVSDVYMKLEMTEVGGETQRSADMRRFAGMENQVGDTIGYRVKPRVGLTIQSINVAGS